MIMSLQQWKISIGSRSLRESHINCVYWCISAEIILHLNICLTCFNQGPPVDCCNPPSLTIFMQPTSKIVNASFHLLALHGMMEAHQSAYHSSHSTETAPLKVKTDVIWALENQEVACLIPLDLSAAFDTIDHDILPSRLKSRFAVTCVVLKWLGSYLKDRTQAVEIGVPLFGGSRSEFVSLRSGILQGSVLGPILFTIYTVPIGNICRRHQVEFHLYADDTHIYLSFRPSIPFSKHECTVRIEKCIEEIGIWMTQNHLKLNSDKMEFILFGTQQQLSKVDDISLHISSDIIKPMDHVRNLGFIMDSLLKNGSHVNKITSSCYCKLHEIARIRPSLDTKSAQLIVQALVLSNIDCCNSLLASSPRYQLDKLQHIQNMSCWVICNIRKHDHVSSAMKNLHWLKIPERIMYKLCLLVYKCQNNLAPWYLSDLLQSRPSCRLLWSSQSNNIYAAYFKNIQCQLSSFSSAGPRA